MFNISYINYDVNTYKNLIYKVDGVSINQYKDKIVTLYSELVQQLNNYEINQKNLENLIPLSISCSSKGYSSPTKGNCIKYKDNTHCQLYNLYDTNKTLKNQIIDNTKNEIYTQNGALCPYCSTARNECRDLDHYIPRQLFPEFSIMSNNLIYSCSKCNQDYKKTNFLDSNGNRFFLNPYFDECLINEILKCEIRVDKFNLDIQFTINEELGHIDLNAYIIACNHLKKLNLNIRYGENCETLKNSFLEAHCNLLIKTHREILQFTINDAQDWIDNEIRKIQRLSHPNNFALLFWRELKKCTVWFENISGKNIP